MIHYHGGPITPDTCAMKAWSGRHAFVSYSRPEQIGLASEICQSFALDNGAFGFWKNNKDVDWNGFYEFVRKWKNHPRCDFAIIPDVIDGACEENDALIAEWPHGKFGVPVWHINEPFERLVKLCSEWPRVAIGSCGEYDIALKPKAALERIEEAISHIVDEYGYPTSKLHLLRGLNPRIFTKIPVSSADSTNVARNIKIDKNWYGAYQPQSRETRAAILVERIESNMSAACLREEARKCIQ